jgi:hypothetical protein
MSEYNRSSNAIGDPYSFMALAALRQAFLDIECYYTRHGPQEAILEGKRSIDWIMHMKGNFVLLSSATEMPIEQFHQSCIEQINFIRKKARAR